MCIYCLLQSPLASVSAKYIHRKLLTTQKSRYIFCSVFQVSPEKVIHSCTPPRSPQVFGYGMTPRTPKQYKILPFLLGAHQNFTVLWSLVLFLLLSHPLEFSLLYSLTLMVRAYCWRHHTHWLRNMSIMSTGKISWYWLWIFLHAGWLYLQLKILCRNQGKTPLTVLHTYEACGLEICPRTGRWGADKAPMVNW